MNQRFGAVLVWVCLAALAAGGLCMDATAAEGPRAALDPANAIHEWVLEKATSDTGGLRLLLRVENGRIAAGVTKGPLGQTDVDCTNLKLDGQAVSGSVKVSIGYDGYYPADGKPLLCEYRVDVKVAEGAVKGTFEGTAGAYQAKGAVTGGLLAPPDLRGYWVLNVQMENASGTETLNAKAFGRRVYPKLFLKDGQPVMAMVYGWGGRAQINYFESEIIENQLVFDSRKITGTLTVQPTGQGPAYVYTLDGTVAGAEVSGVFKKRVGDQEHAGGPFHGSFQPMPERPLDRSLYYIELRGAVERTWVEPGPGAGGLQLMAFAPCLEGKFGMGLAYAAAWNHVYHDVDATGLKLDGTTLSGELKATLNADAYMPPDKQPVSGAYRITAKVVDGRIIQGTFTGLCKDRKVSGAVCGELLDQPPVPEPVNIHVKLEDGVNGGAPWFRRTYIGFEAVKGAATSGGMSNNKGGWKGTFKRAEVKFDGAVFTATIEGSVDETKGPEKGAYTFKLTGRVIGTQLIGRCDTYRDGQQTKTGTPFMGGFSAGRGAPAPAATPD